MQGQGHTSQQGGTGPLLHRSHRRHSHITVDRVGDLLETTIRKADIVRSLGSISVSLLLCAEVVVGVVILDGVLVGVEGWLIGVGWLSTVGWGGSRGGKAGCNKGRESNKNLHDCWLCGLC